MSVRKRNGPAGVQPPRSPDQEEILLIETSVSQTIAERIEQELDRLRAARPALAARIDRAGNILVTHLSCRRSNVIRVRVGADSPRFLVSSASSKGAVYVVDPANWSCSCPDHHRRGAVCKHALACWALGRASARPTLQAADLLQAA